MRSSPKARTSAWAMAISHSRSAAAVRSTSPCRTSAAKRQHCRRYSTSLASLTDGLTPSREKAPPDAPRQKHEGVGIVPSQEQQIVFAEPTPELHQTAAAPARLAFGNERRCFTAERIDVDVVTAATKPARTGERIALGMNAESAVRLDDLSLNAVALPAMASTAHVGTPSGTGFACGKR